MTTAAILALVALAAAMVLFAARGSGRSPRRVAADGGYVYVDGGAGADCSSGSDGGGCGGAGGGGGGGGD